MNAAAYHGAKNGKWISKTGGAYTGTAINVENLISVSRPPVFEKYERYADNRRVLNIPSDQGFSGANVLAAPNTDWEIELGMKSNILGSAADVKMTSYKPGAFYYEFDAKFEDGTAYVVKCWDFNVVVGKPEQTTATDTNTISPNDWSYPVDVKGEPALDADGNQLKDERGFDMYVYRQISVPGDANYTTFGDAVPELKVVTP